MTKKKLIRIIFSLPILLLLIVGCEVNQTKSNGGSGSGTSTPELPAHGQTTINLMEMDVFNGAKLNTSFITWLEGYCMAGPTQLIIADMSRVPDQFTRSIAPASVGAQMFALASTYAGVFASHFDNGELVWFYENQDQIYEWWDRYIAAIITIMQKAPQTTALIIINDEPDLCGARLGYAIERNMKSVGNRVTLGAVLDEWRSLQRR